MRLLPRAEAYRWGGAVIDDVRRPDEELKGGAFCIEFLGIHLEFAAARVARLSQSKKP